VEGKDLLVEKNRRKIVEKTSNFFGVIGIIKKKFLLKEVIGKFILII
jgi:hypothetical protein